ncbi:MAG: hypothetical protein AAF936_08495 [Pseudomonadota bacterium]
MPRGSGFYIVPHNAAQQFDRFIEKTVNAPDVARGSRNDYELLYTRDAHGGSLDFKKRLPSSKTISEWWARRRQRKQTRNEITRLIDESLGKDFAGVRSWGSTKSMGARLVSDLAPQGIFSVTKIDEEALRKIARTVHAMRQEINLHKAGASIPNGTHSLLDASVNRRQHTTFTLSADKLKVLYSRAAALGPVPDGGRPHDPLPEDDSLLDIESEDASGEMRTPEMEQQDKTPSPPLIGPDPRNQDMAVIEETGNEDWSDNEAEQDITVNRKRAASEGAPQADRGAADFALSEAYRRGTSGKDRDWDKAAYHLALAMQKGSEEAAAELEDIAENGDRRVQRAIAKVYSEGRDDVDQNMEEAAIWLARSWQGLRAAHNHTDWVTALYVDKDNVAIPPGAMEHALSKLFLTGNDWVDQSLDKAAYFLLLAAQKGDDKAAARLAALAESRGAEGEDLALQLALYHVHHQGRDGLEPDMGRAALWLARATNTPADQDGADNAERRETLSWLEAQLFGPEHDIYERQIILDPVLFELGQLYRTGREDIERDPNKAAYFLALAAEPGVMGDGDEDAIATLKELEGEMYETKYGKFQKQTKDSDSALQYALYEVYRKGADGIERNMTEAGPWLMRAMGVEMTFLSIDRLNLPTLSFLGHKNFKPWEGLPDSLKNIVERPSYSPDRALALWKIYSDGTDDVEPDKHTAVYWLVKAHMSLRDADKEFSDFDKSSSSIWEVTKAFTSLSWRDFKKYADPSFCADKNETYYNHRGMRYRSILREKLENAILFHDDPEAASELAQLNKVPDYLPGPIAETHLTAYTKPNF